MILDIESPKDTTKTLEPGLGYNLEGGMGKEVRRMFKWDGTWVKPMADSWWCSVESKAIL